MAGLVLWVIAGIILWAAVRERRGGGRGARQSGGQPWGVAVVGDRWAAEAEATRRSLEATDPYQLAVQGKLPNPLMDPVTAPPPLGQAVLPIGNPLWPTGSGQ